MSKYDDLGAIGLNETEAKDIDPKSYIKALKKAKDSLKETASDFAASAGQGALFNLGDELGGAIQGGLDKVYSAFGDSPSEINKQLELQGFGKVGPTSSAEMYEQGRDETRADFAKRQERSPIASLVGELSGAVAGGIGSTQALGKAFKGAELLGTGKALPKFLEGTGATADKVAKFLQSTKTGRIASAAAEGAPIGALAGFGQSEDSGKELVGDTAKGALTGSIAGAALSGLVEAGKAGAKAIGSTEIGKKIGTAFSLGKEGLDDARPDMVTGELTGKKVYGTGKDAGQNVARMADTQAENVASGLLKGDEKLGKEFQGALEDLKKRGVTIKPNPKSIESIDDLASLLDEKPNVLGRDRTNEALTMLKSYKSDSLDPKSAHSLKLMLRDAKNYFNRSNVTPDQMSTLDRGLMNLDSDLKALPEFQQVNKNFKDFREQVLEPLVNKGETDEFSQKYLSDVTNPDLTIKKQIKEFINNISNTKASNDDKRIVFDKFLESANKFEANNPGKLKELGVDLKAIRDNIEKISTLKDVTTASRDPNILSDPNYIMRHFGREAAGLGYKAASGLGTVARKSGDLSKAVFNLSDDTLRQMTEVMPPDSAKSLTDAINNKDAFKRRAILFSLMQNPVERKKLEDKYNDLM